MKLKMTCAALAAAIAAVSAAGTASAQDGSLSYSVAVTSDYVFRGYSQTAEDPALQASVDYTNGAFYAGAWVSNVDFGDTTNAEFDFYFGAREEVAGFGIDVGMIGYTYSDAPSIRGADYTYIELKAAASRAIGPVTGGVSVYYSPDFFGADDEATYVEGSLSFSPIAKWTVSSAIGKQFLDVNDDYTTWNAGVAYAITDNLVADVRYHNTDIDNGGPLADDRVVGTIKVLF